MDEDSFRDFEAAGWEEIAGSYSNSDVVMALTGQAASVLAEIAVSTKGKHVLDLACGPGLAAKEAVKRGATVFGVDIAASMVAIARDRVSGARFLQVPAEHLPFADHSFDGVMCGFGLPHFSDPISVLAETHRVLLPGGRAAFTTWCTPDKVPFFGIVFAAIVENGTLEVPLPDGPDMFQFANEEKALSTMQSIGFEGVVIEELPLSVRVETAAQAMDLVSRATVRTRSLFEAQTCQAQEAIRAAVTDAVKAMQKGSVIQVPMPAVLITGTRP